MGPKIWNSLPEDFKDLTSLQVFTEFIKTWYRSECKYNICKYSGNPYHYIWTSDLTWISLSGNLIPNVNKQNIKRNEAVVFWCVYSWFWVSTHPLGFIFFIFCLFFGLGLIRSIAVFIVQNLIFLLDFMVVSEDK